MALATATLLDVLRSHAAELGIFDIVVGHEPRTPPANGLTAAFWVESITPLGQVSGLTSTAVRVGFRCNVYRSMFAEPYDDIDPAALDACDQLCSAYSGDFTMGGIAFDIDLLGAYGEPLNVRAGYVTIDQKPQRTMSITIPVIVDNLWTQVP